MAHSESSQASDYKKNKVMSLIDSGADDCFGDPCVVGMLSCPIEKLKEVNGL